MNGWMRSLACTILGAGLLCFSEALDARTLRLADLRHEVTLSDPQISPDGRRVALIISTPDFARDTNVSRLVFVDIAGGGSRDFAGPGTTFRGASLSDVSYPRWSPDGSRIAFLAAVGDGPKQIYLASASGGQPHQLTATPKGVDQFAWRPDGRAIAFATQNVPPAISLRLHRGFEVGDNDYLTTEQPLPYHLWLAHADADTTPAAAVALGHGDVIVPSAGGLIEPQHFPNQFFCWVHRGAALVYTKAPDAYQTHWTRSVMTVLDPSSGRERALTGRTGLEAGCDASPDGRRLAYWYPHGGLPLAASDIYVTSPAGGEGVAVTAALDRSPWVVRWMPGGTALLVLAHDGTREGMWIAGIDRSVRRLDIGDLNASAASVSDTGTIAFLASGPQRPTELYIMRARGARPRRLTAVNAYFWPVQLGAVGRIAWRSDGFQETGVLTYPPGFVAARRYPLVLQIHGWPQYASQEAFDTDYPGLTQLLAAHGFVVFEPNYRGSDDMGSAFENAIAGDTVAGPERDIMAGIAAVKARGLVDASRIGVSGWSYGGLLTAWLIGHHDFAAAVAGAAPTDNIVDYAIGSYNILGGLFLGGPLWASRARYQTYVEQSPMTFAWDIHTPTLIMSSVRETTVPVVHSYELFHALRERGVPTQFIAYPSDEHYPTDPATDEDIYQRWAGWFDRYLR